MPVHIGLNSIECPQQVSQISKFNGLRVKSTLAAVLIRKGIFPDCQKASR
jgi:hypothetical protein